MSTDAVIISICFYALINYNVSNGKDLFLSVVPKFLIVIIRLDDRFRIESD